MLTIISDLRPSPSNLAARRFSLSHESKSFASFPCNSLILTLHVLNAFTTSPGRPISSRRRRMKKKPEIWSRAADSIDMLRRRPYFSGEMAASLFKLGDPRRWRMSAMNSEMYLNVIESNRDIAPRSTRCDHINMTRSRLYSFMAIDSSSS